MTDRPTKSSRFQVAPTCGFQKVGPTFFRCFLLTMFKPARVWLSDHKNLLLAVLIVIHLIPLWTFKYFPSQDGPDAPGECEYYPRIQPSRPHRVPDILCHQREAH